MRQTKAFLTTFIITFSIMLCCFAALYWVVGYTSPLSAGEGKSDVPILTPDYNDSKTTLIVMDTESADFFFILKLNALQNKVCLVSIPSSFYLSDAQRTISESMQYAGILQCVQDISTQFDITIDYHLLCDKTSLDKLLGSFSGLDIRSLPDIPQSISSYLLKGSEYVDTATLVNALDMSAAVLDNAVGTEFLNLAGLILIKNNMQNICDYALDDIKECFSYLTTNIGTLDIDRLKRITDFLLNDSTIYDRIVLADTETAQSEIDRMLKE